MDESSPPLAQVHPTTLAIAKHMLTVNEKHFICGDDRQVGDAQPCNLTGVQKPMDHHYKICDRELKRSNEQGSYCHVLQMELTKDMSTVNNTQHKKHGISGLNDQPKRVETYNFVDVEEFNDGCVGRKALPLPAQLTYNRSYPQRGDSLRKYAASMEVSHSTDLQQKDFMDRQHIHQFGHHYHTDMHIGLGKESKYYKGAAEPGKLDALLRVKENIIQEKNKIIEKKKLELNNLQEQLREQVGQRRQPMTKFYDESDVLALKLQEYQYENASLKTVITELAGKKDASVSYVMRKLGKAETELEETKAALRQLSEEKKKDANEYMVQLKDKDTILQKKMNQLEKSLTDARKTIRSKDIQISVMENKCSNMKLNIEGYQEKLNQITLEKLKNGNKCTEDDINELRHQRNILDAECCQLKKLLESTQSKSKVLQSKHEAEIKHLEKRVQQEEDTVTALKEALSSKDEGLKNMQKSMKELARNNQELHEHNINVEEKIHDYERSSSTETMKIYRKFMKEMSECVHDLQGVIQICTERAEGKDPNISMLLGLRASSVTAEYKEDGDPHGIQNMKQKITQIWKMRQDVEKLRTLISDKYAEDIGDNCITQ
ncbi:centrosomal protein of 85 kDa-like isoform X2 [Ptychodera flava]|uniref:centrosomal protein of 85 kDa-like isoform X2 n=1 Tax=Ptychodera flava TaxID=63121 RepID=UPI00396A2A61